MQTPSITQSDSGSKKFVGLGVLGLAVASGLSMFCAPAHAESVLQTMLDRAATPDVLVNPYASDLGGNPVTLNDIVDETNIAIMNGPDANPTAYFDTLAISIDTTTGTGTFTQSVQLNPLTSDETLMFDSNQLLDYGPVTGHPGIVYWFSFKENSNTFYATGGDIIGGLVTEDGSTPADIKEFDLGPAPLPGTAMSGLVMLVGVAGYSIYRRNRSTAVQALS